MLENLFEPELSLLAGQPAAGVPVRHLSFGVRYERRLNLVRYESVTAGLSLWVAVLPEEAVDEQGRPLTDAFGDPVTVPYNLHDCKRRVRELVLANIRAQFARAREREALAYLGLPPPAGEHDPLFVKSALVTLKMQCNLGEYNMVAPEYNDHCDLRDVYLDYSDAHSANSSGLHIALDRIWSGLWANLDDDLARAAGEGETGGYFGLPQVTVETVPPAGTNGYRHANGGG